jgi:hypothetical protein
MYDESSVTYRNSDALEPLTPPWGPWRAPDWTGP